MPGEDRPESTAAPPGDRPLAPSLAPPPVGAAEAGLAGPFGVRRRGHSGAEMPFVGIAPGTLHAEMRGGNVKVL